MRIIIISSIVLVSLLIGCSEKKVDPKEPEVVDSTETIALTNEQLQDLQLVFGSAEKKQISSTIQVQGKIDLPPQNIISVNFALGGFLKSTKLIPGMKISKGEIIAVMEDQNIIQLQQDYLLAQSKLALTKGEYERQKSLYDANAGTSKLMQQAESEMKIQSINAKSLSEKLKLIGINVQQLNENNISGQVPIRSTINGYVSKVHVNTGKYVQPAETLFELIDPDDIHVALTLFEKDLPYVQTGDLVKVKFMQEPSKQYDAEVILVNRNVDDDRTAMAHCHFKQRPANLLPGMFVETTISVLNKQAFVLPEEAIQRSGNKEYVFTAVHKNKVQMIEVTTGLIQDGKIEITSNTDQLINGQVVLKNAYKILGMLKNSEE
jgi:cobalt-zinc-cadmium efflux system membrane fusion protein